MRVLLARWLEDRSGQDLIEYALLAALLAVAVMAAMTTLGQHLFDFYGQIASAS